MLNSTRGQLLRVTTFTSSGTWTKQKDVGFVLVSVIGGGGGNTAAGNSSSFGSHCSATGGARAPASSVTGGAGGAGSGGDLNISGENGSDGNGSVTGDLSYSPGEGGSSFFGAKGKGARGVSFNNGGAGGGGFSQKIVQETSLGATESVTVGSIVSGGREGFVIVYEYSR